MPLSETLIRKLKPRTKPYKVADEKGLWRIPARRIKARQEHVVPALRQVVALFEQLHTLTVK
jgi:hypothetical protein